MLIVQITTNKQMKLGAALTSETYGKKQNLFLQFVIGYNLVNCTNGGWYLPVGQHNEANCNHTSQNKE